MEKDRSQRTKCSKSAMSPSQSGVNKILKGNVKSKLTKCNNINVLMPRRLRGRVGVSQVFWVTEVESLKVSNEASMVPRMS